MEVSNWLLIRFYEFGINQEVLFSKRLTPPHFTLTEK